jgi:transposase
MAKRDCPGCRILRKQVAFLEARLRELEQRLGLNSTNSSIPPSANPPQAPPPVAKKPTGRKPGGQPGHQAFQRVRIPPEGVRHTIALIPPHCEHCHTPLPAQAGPNDPEPFWHQVAELPRTAAVVTEYQAHARTCFSCGHLTREQIPAVLRAEIIGERLGATMSYLAASPHVSKRGVEELVETVFGVPVSLGTVANLEQEMSLALEPAHAEAKQAVEQAPVKNVDETSWKQAGKKRWLWTAATTQVACYVIFAGRNASGLAALLGEKIRGIVCSDRFSVYGSLVTEFRQVCWAHLKRDFQKLVDRGGASKELGEAGLATVALLFEWWHAYRSGSLSRKAMQNEVEGVRQNLKSWLEEGRACADTKTAAFCENLLSIEPALWTFVYKRGVEPTNNHAERMLRSGVLWRKISFGCHSAAGCQFVERVLTVTQTLRLQNRPVLEYLQQALSAHRLGQPAPQMLLKA